MLNTKFSPWPSFTQEEANAVQNVLLSNKVNYWTGQEGREFEKEFAAFADSKYAVALGNGTLALDIALKAMKVGAGDEVITTPRTFLASASSIVTAGSYTSVSICSNAILRCSLFLQYSGTVLFISPFTKSKSTNLKHLVWSPKTTTGLLT